MSHSEPATKADVEEVVGRVGGEIASDILQLISDRLDEQDEAISGVQTTLNRVENKLNPAVDQVDDHEIRIKKFEHKAA